MEFRCMICGIEDKMEKERLEKLQSIESEVLVPMDYIEAWNILKGRTCKDGKRHKGNFKDEFVEKVTNYKNEYRTVVDKFRLETEPGLSKIRTRIEELRKELSKSETTETELVEELNNEKETIEKIESEFKEFSGTSIEIWG